MRHLAFWIVFGFHYGLQNMLIGGFHEALHLRPIPDLVRYVSFFFPAFILSSYFFMYVLIPVFLFQRRITIFILSFSGMILLNIIAAYFTGIYYIHITQGIPYEKIGFDLNKYYTIVNGLWIPLIVMGLTGGIRLTKKWILQEKANEILMKQKISSELKLLKTQIHPRFLFHSLNSLEDKLWKKQTDSPGLILKLADILSYILYESDGEYVLLEKEIEIIREYLDLQKNNCPQTLHISLDIHVPASNLYIAPLILLSFLETSFENLIMNDDYSKSMYVSIKANEEILFFNLTCSEDRMQETDLYQKPFWSDITKRLEKLYPNNHQLLLKSNSKEILIELRLNMIKSDNTSNLPFLVLNSSYEYV